MAAGALPRKPVLIIGAGVSGLVLAQYLRKSGIEFLIFERDSDLTTRGVGWGLTLHWSLPALRALIPDDLASRLPETYVDSGAVKRGELSTFPFYDLTTGELVASTKAAEAQRVRVTREKLRSLLATDIDIQWGKALASLETEGDGVRVTFKDGSEYLGSLVAGCDGSYSATRRSLFPDISQNFNIPIELLGFRLSCTEEQVAGLRKLDPFFLQGSASGNDTFAYFSILDVPGNTNATTDKVSLQIAISWPARDGFFGRTSAIPPPATNAERMELVKEFARTWAEPFRSAVLNIPDDVELKTISLADWAPPQGLRGTGRVVLFGDAIHAMAMYRGEGANHTIIDVLDFAELVAPHLTADGSADIRAAIDTYEDRVVARARRAVLASRKACMDAHDWTQINDASPLLSKRAIVLDDDFEHVHSGITA
ncbi:FAD binding domain-containing protein [Thozetella sp. PMI_491]|nr:FAD binding domain-containing protein [Thozetella sp. PMI_491]